MTYTLVDVLLPLKIDRLLTYKTSTPIAVGSYVLVPLRGSLKEGIVWGHNPNQRDINYKEINKVLDVPPMSEALRNFFTEFAQYNMCPAGLVFKSQIQYLRDLEKSTTQPTLAASLQCSQLNEEQTTAAEHIVSKSNAFNTILLDGVTGSGKTETYMTAIQNIIANGGQTLILLPEILLVAQIRSMISRYCANMKGVVVWHSTARKKGQVFCDIIHGSARIIIGARSALFLPYKDLKVIIIDEEHDSSYKQDSSYCYNARDMAIMRAQKENIPIVLSSATPSLETINNVRSGKYSCVALRSSFYGCGKPTIEVADMKAEKGNLSAILIKAIQNTLQKQNQVLLFLNRRGYCFLTICTSCGYKPACPKCNKWLVEHKNELKYRCHYCDYARKITKEDNCNRCRGPLKKFGTGVERLLEEVSSLFPEARLTLISSDTMRSEKSATKIVSDILHNKVDIIIGTQLIAKGHNFPNLATIGIIDADSVHHGIDLRSAEKTYQALSQVSGRVGRYEIPGHIIIQTHEPHSLLVQSLQERDREKFYEYEINTRIQSSMPPFTRLCCMTITGHVLNLVQQSAKAIAASLQKAATEKIKIMGPSPSPVPYINRLHRYQIIVRTEKHRKIQNYIATAIGKIKLPSTVNLKIDIDPVNFM